ncbi:MAG: DUF488 domain-containing protein [Methanosarcinales archaeon Met12]|nr:MAG: DUF488 domain-containing protein [Methanosarcinales archaeon Met12]
MQPKKALNQAGIYTVGHSNVEFEKFLSLLNGIEVLVDVRSVPFSKYTPQFNIKNIKMKLENVGIEYVFMEDEYMGNVLGGEPRDGDCYENGKIIYENVMKKGWYKRGILALIELANKKGTVIMCSEEDPHKCHRHHLITQSLLKEGMDVFHIRGDGSKEKIEKPEKIMVQLTLI